MDFKQWSLRGKIVLVGVLLPTLLIVVLLRLYSTESREKTLNAFADKARGICLTAESTRQEMEAKWELGLFSAEQLREFAAQGHQDKVLAAVPVVSAWNAAMRKAQEGGYTFKVPKFKPRNPKNEPDPLEAKALKLMTDQNLDEYYEVDPAMNAVRYFRAVRLSATCMLCHGDPATSQALWGNSNGTDPTGGPLENWKVGEIHGAFEVIQSLDAADKQLSASISKAIWLVAVGLVIMAVLFATLVIRIVSSGVISPIRRVIANLSSGADNLLDAATQVSSSSHELADGAARQAASLEETSSALEEVSSMSKQNADNVNQTSLMAENARKSAEVAQDRMLKMGEAISSIKKSADQTAVIMKTIDEIAFQTNLLALNAAVEAARAGEAGAGFAVVAEEVRSLALRSAEAAKQTAQLIEESQKNAGNGVTAADDVKDILSQIVDGVNKVSQLAKEITVASNEQAQGVQQINSAVSDVDQVTQTNAAISEEAASASEELSGQAKEINELVHVLADIVGVPRSASGMPVGADRARAKQQQMALPARKKSVPASAAKKTGPRQLTPPKGKPAAAKPAEVIPFDDDDFENF
ncbi:MAG: methyl-accepting chemotaxis protein [Desulfurivibrionaceae bacterium]|jgi:methyl-accepting chemotaxis protein